MVLHLSPSSPLGCCLSTLRPLGEVASHLETMRKKRLLFLTGPRGAGKKHLVRY